MTTTVKVITHDWPVHATTTDGSQVEGEADAVHVETIDPDRERVFHLTSMRSLTLKELPKPGAVDGPADENQADAATVDAETAA